MENGWGGLGTTPEGRPSARDGAAGLIPSPHDGAQRCSACLGSALVLEHCLGSYFISWGYFSGQDTQNLSRVHSSSGHRRDLNEAGTLN